MSSAHTPAAIRQGVPRARGPGRIAGALLASGIVATSSAWAAGCNNGDSLVLPQVCDEISINAIGPTGTATPAGTRTYNGTVGGSAGMTAATTGEQTAAYATADFGSLHALSVSTSSVLLPYNGTGYEVDFANSTASAGFGDNAAVTSSLLAPGAAATVHLTVTAHGAFQGGGGTIVFYLRDNGATLVQQGPITPLASTSPTYSFDRFFDVHVGDQLSFYFEITAGSRVSDDFASYAPYTNSADMSNTGLLYLDVATAGVGLAAASGHDYATPSAVPEPPTAALMLFALGGGAVRRWHGRRGRSAQSGR